MDCAGAGFGTHVRREVDLERRRISGDAGMLKEDALDAGRTRREAGAALDHRFQPLVGAFVAAQAGERHDRRQRLPRASRRRPPDLAGFDAQARDRLVPLVEDVEERPVLFGVGLRQQPPHANHGRQFLFERARRQVPHEVHGLRHAHGQRRSSVARLPRHDCGLVDARPPEACAGFSDASVERVEHGESMPADGVMTRGEQRAQALSQRRARYVAADEVHRLAGGFLARVGRHAQRSSRTARTDRLRP